MFFLTRQEQQVIVLFFLIFLLGLGVKQWRAKHALGLLRYSPHPTAASFSR